MENRILGTDWEVPDHPLYTKLPAAEAAALIRAGRVKYDPETFLPIEIVDPPDKSAMGGEGGFESAGQGQGANQNQGTGGNGKGTGDNLPPSPSFGAAKSDKSEEDIIEEQAAADMVNLFNAMKRVEHKVRSYEPPDANKEFQQ